MKVLRSRDVLLGFVFAAFGAAISLLISFGFYYRGSIDDAEAAAEEAEQAETLAKEDAERTAQLLETTVENAESAERTAQEEKETLERLLAEAETAAEATNILRTRLAAEFALGLAREALRNCEANPTQFPIEPTTGELKGFDNWKRQRTEQLDSIEAALIDDEGDWVGALDDLGSDVISGMRTRCLGFEGVPRIELGL